ncbi:MAG: hypothetical protein GC131_04605 [Alphaproteobacteria bacterium]|nr:hypothetical protein [Alphaproteobacteria bacterium]
MKTEVTLDRLLWLVAALALSLFILVGFQMQQILIDRAALKKVYDGQQVSVERGAKVQGQLDALAVGTLHLAEAGNKHAQGIVTELKKAGITINPEKAKPAEGEAAEGEKAEEKK